MIDKCKACDDFRWQGVNFAEIYVADVDIDTL